MMYHFLDSCIVFHYSLDYYKYNQNSKSLIDNRNSFISTRLVQEINNKLRRMIKLSKKIPDYFSGKLEEIEDLHDLYEQEELDKTLCELKEYAKQKKIKDTDYLTIARKYKRVIEAGLDKVKSKVNSILSKYEDIISQVSLKSKINLEMIFNHVVNRIIGIEKDAKLVMDSIVGFCKFKYCDNESCEHLLFVTSDDKHIYGKKLIFEKEIKDYLKKNLWSEIPVYIEHIKNIST